MNIVVLALGSIGLSVAAQFALKAGMGQPEMQAMMSQPLSVRAAIATATNLLVVTGFALYGLGAVVWLGVLARWDVSKAYPLVGLGFAATVGIHPGIFTGYLPSPVFPRKR